MITSFLELKTLTDRAVQAPAHGCTAGEFAEPESALGASARLFTNLPLSLAVVPIELQPPWDLLWTVTWEGRRHPGQQLWEPGCAWPLAVPRRGCTVSLHPGWGEGKDHPTNLRSAVITATQLSLSGWGGIQPLWHSEGSETPRLGVFPSFFADSTSPPHPPTPQTHGSRCAPGLVSVIRLSSRGPTSGPGFPAMSTEPGTQEVLRACSLSEYLQERLLGTAVSPEDKPPGVQEGQSPSSWEVTREVSYSRNPPGWLTAFVPTSPDGPVNQQVRGLHPRE